MHEYDIYVNAQKPGLGLYVRKGAALSEFADPKEWIYYGTTAEGLLPPGVAEAIEADGHAFRDMA